MPCSEKKLQANRQNAQKSTGPKSKDGKAKVALNPLKHGLRAQQIVLPGEDAAAFDGMVATWMDDWKPPTDARRVLVEQAVAHAWRLRRCLKAERDHLIERGREAVRAHDRAAESRARNNVNLLAIDPVAALEALLAEREGTAALLGVWEELAEVATADDWSEPEEHHACLLNLLGHDGEADAEELGGPALASWRLVDSYDPDRRPDRAEAESLADELSRFIAEQVAEVERYLADRFAPLEQDTARLAAAASASLDDSDEGRALLRYEGQHGREFRATLNQLIKLTQTGVDLVEDEPGPAADEPAQADVEKSVEAVDVVAPNKATEAEPSAPNKATEGSSADPAAPNEATDDAPPKDNPTGRAIAAYLARVSRSLSNPQISI